MKTIYKYLLEIEDSHIVKLPDGAILLDVQVQDGQPCLWALVDNKAPIEDRVIFIQGTGHSCENLGKHVATFQMNNGRLIFHVFEPPTL